MTNVSKFSVVAAAAFMLFVFPGAQAYAASDEECEALFKTADTDGDGSIAAHEDKKWEEAIHKSGKVKTADATVVQKQEFMDSCKMGDLDQLMK